MPSPPAPLTPDDLAGRIVHWNLTQCGLGGAILVCSAFPWLLTIRGTIALVEFLQTLPIPWSESEAFARTLTAIILLLLVGIGCSSRLPLFVWEGPDDGFTGIELPQWRLNDQWSMEFWLALLGIAPALTFWGLCVMCRCFSFEKRRIDLACRAYDLLASRTDWAPYPKLLSQRRAVELLYHLKLIRVSKRFGNREIHINTSVVPATTPPDCQNPKIGEN